jgi:3-oxoacyl-[acyl-carrier protein] reductase
MINPGLTGKVAVVTGGNNPRGIGAATAKAFAAQGARVLIHFFRAPEEITREMRAAMQAGAYGEAYFKAAQTLTADELVREIRAAGGQAESCEADLSDPAAVPQLFDRAEAAFGPVEVLVNNAALCEPDTFLPGRSPETGERSIHGLGPKMTTLSAESHDRHFAVNSRAVALLMAEFARRHIARGGRWGRIINISTDGAAGAPDEISYWASKHALESYSRAGALELAPYGITVNVASLGPIQTGWMSPELEAKVVPAIPLGRIGQPEDVADVIVFLASEQARWLTGQLIYVGGGNRMPL